MINIILFKQLKWTLRYWSLVNYSKSELLKPKSILLSELLVAWEIPTTNSQRMISGTTPLTNRRSLENNRDSSTDSLWSISVRYTIFWKGSKNSTVVSFYRVPSRKFFSSLKGSSRFSSRVSTGLPSFDYSIWFLQEFLRKTFKKSYWSIIPPGILIPTQIFGNSWS